MSGGLAIVVGALAVGVLMTHTAHAEQKLVVVVAKGSKLTSISKSDLKRCFLGDSISSDGKPLVPFNSEANTPVRSSFDSAVLAMSPAQVGRFWVDRKVRGQSAAPRSLPSMAHVVKVVQKFPNAISYVPADQLTPALQPVAIDGVSHADARYSLKVP
jgi:ABC-type phosphate transport system substrate-binding protein